MPKINPPKDTARQEKLEAFDRLLTIMDELRLNCPWDSKQTLESLRHLTIEETYELSDAIMGKDMKEIKKELGDIMLHLVFYAKIADEMKAFSLTEVLHGICDKLVHRHPHIYGDIEVKDEEEVKQNWEKIKLKEKGNESVLSGVPKALPAMVKAMRMQEKVRGVGFEWERAEQVWEKVEEEMREFRQEFNTDTNTPVNQERALSEFGDMLFTLINYAQFVDINPEEALEHTNRKFIKRFQYLESQSKKDGKKISEMTLPEMDVYWNEAKKLK